MKSKNILKVSLYLPHDPEVTEIKYVQQVTAKQIVLIEKDGYLSYYVRQSGVCSKDITGLRIRKESLKKVEEYLKGGTQHSGYRPVEGENGVNNYISENTVEVVDMTVRILE